MTQTRIGSAVESAANVAIGYGVALASQLAIFPLFGIHLPLSSNLAIGAWFTVISLVRSYCVRRSKRNAAGFSRGASTRNDHRRIE